MSTNHLVVFVYFVYILSLCRPNRLLNYSEQDEVLSHQIGEYLEVAGEIKSRPWHNSIRALFRYQKNLLSGMECRQPDHANHRMLLWKSLSGISHNVVESRSQILVPLFLRFIK